MVDIIKNIAVWVGCAISCITLISMLCKPIRKSIVEWVVSTSKADSQQEEIDDLTAALTELTAEFKDFRTIITEDMEVQRETDKNTCRNIIKNIFYKYCSDGRIPIHEYKIASFTYDLYHNKLHGNSFITDLWERMQHWEIDCTYASDE